MTRYASFGHCFRRAEPGIPPVRITGASQLGGFRSSASVKQRQHVTAASQLGGFRSSATVQIGGGIVASGASRLGGFTSAASVTGSFKSPIDLAANHVYWPRTVSDVVLSSASITSADQSDFTSAGWTKTNIGTISADNTTDPDATSLADLILDTSTNGTHQLAHAFTSVGTHTITISVYAKANTLSWIYLQGNSSSTIRAFFNVSSGAVGNTGAGVVSASITAAANGFFLCSMTFVYSSGSLVIGLASADNTASYAGTGKSVWLYKADCNQDRVSTLNDINGGTAKNAAQATANNEMLWVPNSAFANGQPACRGSGGIKDLVAGAAADWSFLSNGTGGSIMLVSYHPASSSVLTLLTTNGVSTTGSGMLLRKNGTTGVDWFVGNSTTSIVSLSATGDPSGLHTYIMTYGTSDSPDAHFYVDGVLASSMDQAASPAGGSPSSALRIGNVSAAADDDYLAVATWNSVLSAATALQAHAWAFNKFGAP